MRNIDARVTGYEYTTFHAYTTEVEVDGCTWTLNIRYNTFYQFYERLVAIEKYFTVKFPPKGGLFFSPAPEERQEQLDEFILSALAYFEMRGHPKRMEALLNKLLQIPEHLGVKVEEEERTASEGSFEEHEDYLESMHENDPSLLIGQDENKTEVVVKVDNQELQSEVEMEATTHDVLEIGLVELQTKPETVEANEISQQVHAKEDRPQKLTGTKTLVKKAIVSTIKEPFNKSEAAKVEKITEEQQSVMEDKATGVEVEMRQSEAAKVEKITEEQQSVMEDKAIEGEVAMQQKEAAVTEVEERPVTPMVEEKTTTHEGRVKATTIQDTTAPSIDRKTHVLEPAAPIDADLENVPETVIELNTISLLAPQVEEKPVEEHESSLKEDREEPDLEPCNMETDPENTMVGWFRRIITFGSSPDEKEETEAVEMQEEPEVVEKQEEEEEADAQVETAATKAEACTKAEEEVKAEAIEAELLLAAQELKLRLRRYRHPIFFRSFNHDVGISCFFLPQRSSSDVFE